MHPSDAFDCVISTLHDAALDDTLWPSTSTLIDEAVGMAGSHLTVVSGHTRVDAELLFGDHYDHGELNGLGRLWARDYFSLDERLPRLLHLPDSQVFPVRAVFPASTLKTSPVYNDLLPRAGGRNGLDLRLDGPDGLHICWGFTDPLDPNGWRSEQISLIQQLLPHIRQFVRVRQALARAEALNTTLTQLLDNALIGVLFLDRHGTIVETNTCGLGILQRGDGVGDRGGLLHARFPTDNATLQRLIANALPRWGQTVSGGSMTIRRSSRTLPLTLHISPVEHRADFGAQRTAALVLLVDSVERPQIDPASLASALNLTRAESQVAAALAAGHSVRDIAVSTHRSQATVRSHIQHIYLKLGIHTQAHLVRLILTTAGLPLPRA